MHWSGEKKTVYNRYADLISDFCECKYILTFLHSLECWAQLKRVGQETEAVYLKSSPEILFLVFNRKQDNSNLCEFCIYEVFFSKLDSYESDDSDASGKSGDSGESGDSG